MAQVIHKKNLNLIPMIFCNCDCGEQIREYDSKGKKRKFKDGHYGPYLKKIEEKNNELCLKILEDEIIKAAMFECAFLRLPKHSKNPDFRILDNKRTKKILEYLKPRLESYGIPLKRVSSNEFATGNSYLLKELYNKWYINCTKIKDQNSVEKTSETKFYLNMIPEEKITNEDRVKGNEIKNVHHKQRFEEGIKKVLENPELANALKNDPVINGVLLGDGSIPIRRKNNRNYNLAYHNYNISIEQNQLRNYILHLKEYLEKKYLDDLVIIKPTFKMGVPTSYSREDLRTGNTYYVLSLQTRKHPFFTKLKEIWYPNGKKIVPSHLKLDAETVAWWYMGDGGLSHHDDEQNIEKGQIELSTHSFTLDDVERLIEMLKQLGITKATYSLADVNKDLENEFEWDKLENEERKWIREQLYEIKDSIRNQHGPQYIIKISTSEQVQKFIDLVKDYVVPEFDYKISDVYVRSRDQFREQRIDETIERIKDLPFNSEFKSVVIKGNEIRKAMKPSTNPQIYNRLKAILQNWIKSPNVTSRERDILFPLIIKQPLDNFDNSGNLEITDELKQYLVRETNDILELESSKDL